MSHGFAMPARGVVSTVTTVLIFVNVYVAPAI